MRGQTKISSKPIPQAAFGKYRAGAAYKTTQKGVVIFVIKVIQVVSDTNIGGAGRYLLNYLKYFDRTAFHVSVILPENSRLTPFVRRYGVEIIEVPFMADVSYDRRCVKVLCNVFRRIRPDILHTHASLSARVAGRRMHVPCIINTRHCMEDVSGGLKARLKGAFNNHYSDIFIGVADAVGQNLIDCGAKKEKVRVVYNGVEPLDMWEEEKRREERLRLGVAPEDILFGIVARVEPIKGHRFFVEAAAQLADMPAKFLVVGDGSLLEDVKRQAHELGLDGRMIFTGYVQDTTGMMNAIDVNVIASYSEAMSLAVLEAMSLGKPSVATDSGGTREIVTDGITGLLVPPADSRALAGAMRRMMAEPELRARMSCGAKEAFEKEFTAQKMVANLERLYNSCIPMR